MIKFLYSNTFDGATATALNNAGTNYVVANVQSRLLKKVYRSTALANQWLKFDQGSAKNIQMFTFFYNNFTTAATVKLYASATDLGNTEAAWAGAAYSTTITSFDTRAGYLSLNQTYRYWLLTISDATNPDGYIQLGRVYGGVPVSPTENFSEDIGETFTDPSDQQWTVGGHVYSVQRERYKTFNFAFSDIAAANQTVLRNLWASVYKTEPFVIAFDDSAQPVEWTRYGVLTSDLNFTFSANARANANLTFRELR
jgi:hypothetical protein